MRSLPLRSTLAILVLVAATALVAAGPALAAEAWRMATKMPPDGPEGRVFQRFADLVEQKSGGQLRVQVYPNEQLGKEAAVLEQLKLGTIHLYAEGSVFLQKWVPELRWVSGPFLFEDRDHWVRFIHHPMVQGWYQKAREQAGIGILGEETAVLRGPYRVLLTKRPIRSVEDVRGLKLRMASDKTGVEVWTHLGAEVRVLGWAETYESIQRGIVDSVTSPIALVESMKFYEVAPHVTTTHEYWQSVAFMMNQKAFDRQPAEVKRALLEAHRDAAAFSLEVMGRATEESMARMKGRGVTFARPDLGPFVQKMTAYYSAKEASGELPRGFLAAVEETRRK